STPSVTSTLSLRAALPISGIVRYVPHHVAHAASAALAAPGPGDGDVLVLDGRGEAHSHLAGVYAGGTLTALGAQRLPHSLGLMRSEEHTSELQSREKLVCR